MTQLKTKFLTTTRNYAKDTGGNFAIMMGILLFAFVGALACSIDLTNSFKTKSRLQDVTDIIALQAAKDKTLDTPAKLLESAEAYIANHYPDGSGDRIVIESITRTGDTVNVEARNNIDAYFAQIFGYDTLDVAVYSSATISDRLLEVALVLDTTGSMGADGKLEALQTSANNLIDTLDLNTNKNIKMSVVPFAHYVSVGADKQSENWIELTPPSGVAWNGCVGSRPSPWNERVEYGNAPFPGLVGLPVAPQESCGGDIQPLTNNASSIKSTINNMEAEGWTYIPSGLAWGWRTLDARAPFTEASANTRGNTDKILILMTDGKNTRSNSGLKHDVANGVNANVVTRKMCRNINDEEISVYTIAFDLDDQPTLNMLRNCATNNDNYFDASNAAELDDAFESIADSLSELRLTN